MLVVVHFYLDDLLKGDADEGSGREGHEDVLEDLNGQRDVAISGGKVDDEEGQDLGDWCGQAERNEESKVLLERKSLTDTADCLTYLLAPLVENDGQEKLEPGVELRLEAERQTLREVVD